MYCKLRTGRLFHDPMVCGYHRLAETGCRNYFGTCSEKNAWRRDHLGPSYGWTVEALDRMIQELEAEGYEFVTVSENLGL